MAALKIMGFGGMVPALDDRLLPDTAAAFSENAWLYSGNLVGLPVPTEIHDCDLTSTGKVYRIPASYSNPSAFDDSTWMEFGNADTVVVRAPVFGDTYDRYYWLSPGDEPEYNSLARIQNGDGAYLLGIPAPGSAPSIIVTGGSGPTVTRAYLYTWVSTFGEEGPPSPAVIETGNTDGSWDLTLTGAAADDLDGPDRDLDTVRIYRTVTSGAGVATYFLVAEQDITDTTYSDTSTDEDITANEQLQSVAWAAPPTDLEGWTVMNNGIIAAFRSNEVWFSEPFRPHAWPASYVVTVEYPIVGLGVINNTLVVCTRGYPVTMSGNEPKFMTQATLTQFEPCTHRGSILSAPEGVYYSSPNGLVLVVPGRAENLTRNLVTKDRWYQLAGGAALRAARLGTGYYAFGSVSLGVFSSAFEPTAFAQEDFSNADSGVLVDPQNERVAFNLLTSDDPTINVWNDPWSGEVFVLRDNKVYYLNLNNAEYDVDPCTWRSKVFQLPDKKNLAALKIYFTVPESTPTLNPVRNGAFTQTLASDQYGLVRCYMDGVHRWTQEFRVSGELLRLPSGFMADFYQLELETRVRVHSIQVASSVKELRNV